MPIKQRGMPTDQQSTVAEAMADALGTRHQIITGIIRESRSGCQWVNFGGGNWYRLIDTPLTEDDDLPPTEGRKITCVMTDDGAPLGNPDQGPLVISWFVRRGAWHPVAVCVNTGYNYAEEIVW